MKELAHDTYAELAKLRTILSLMKDASSQEIRDEFVPMASACAEKLRALLDQVFKV